MTPCHHRGRCIVVLAVQYVPHTLCCCASSPFHHCRRVAAARLVLTSLDTADQPAVALCALAASRPWPLRLSCTRRSVEARSKGCSSSRRCLRTPRPRDCPHRADRRGCQSARHRTHGADCSPRKVSATFGSAQTGACCARRQPGCRRIHRSYPGISGARISYRRCGARLPRVCHRLRCAQLLAQRKHHTVGQSANRPRP